MFTWLKQVRERWAQRRAERRASAGERALRQNEAKAQRIAHMDKERGGDGGYSRGPGM